MASSEDLTRPRATKRMKVKEESLTRTESKEKAVCLEGQSSKTRIRVVRGTEIPQKAVQKAVQGGPELPEEAVQGALEYFEKKRREDCVKRNFPILSYQSSLCKRYPTFIKNALKGIIGRVPGVPVGLTVRYRDELRLLGIHREIRRGIDSKDVINRGDIARRALCVVFSGVYEDCEEQGEKIFYVGEGGRDEKTGKQCKDQPRSLGNDALINNFINVWPVRVVSGRKDASSPSKSLYIYRGLYKVADWKYKKVREESFKVNMFELVPWRT